MRTSIAVLLAVAIAAMLLAAPAVAALPKPKRTTEIEVPKSIAGVKLKQRIKRADKVWGRRGDCDFKGFKSCLYEGRNERSGTARIEAARRGKVSSFAISAGRSNNGERYVFAGRLLKFETKEGIGLGDKGPRVRRAYPKAIRTANKTGYIVEGKGRSYMTFRTLDGKRITAISVVDGRHQG